MYRISIGADDDDDNDSLETDDGAAALLEGDRLGGTADEDNDSGTLDMVDEDVLLREKYEDDDEDSLVAVAGIVLDDDE